MAGSIDNPARLQATTDALNWVRSHVGPIGRVHWRKQRVPWSLVAGVETADGLVWFKEVSPQLADEPALTDALARRVPHSIPEVIATAETRLLTRDAGPHLGRAIGRDSTSTAVLENALTTYAELGIALVEGVRDLPTFDARPDTLARTFGDIVAPLVDALGDAIPFTVIHGDLFKKNICVKGSQVVFLDWAGSAYGHPFFGVHTIFRSLVEDFGASPGSREIQRVRDAYLEPWSTYAPLHELQEIFAAAHPLGALCRILRLRRLLESVPAESRAAYVDRAHKWIESFWAAQHAGRPEKVIAELNLGASTSGRQHP